jgi:hypothetical protein
MVVCWWASRPKLTQIALDAWHEFGVPLWVEPACTAEGPKKYVRAITTDNRGTVAYPCRWITGDMHPFWRGAPGVIAQSSDFTYMHTDADTPEIVPWTGLGAATCAFRGSWALISRDGGQRIQAMVGRVSLTDVGY